MTIFDKLKLWRLKRKAMKLYKKLNQQLFIVPIDNWKHGKWIITSRKGNELYNRAATKKGMKTISFNQMCRTSIWISPPEKPTRWK